MECLWFFFFAQVSIYGHSLGTVLSYDILCHQTDQSSTSTAPMVDLGTEGKKSHENRTNESKISASPTEEVNPDVSETCEKDLPPSSDSSDIENGVSSSRDDSDHSSSADDNSEKISEAEKDVEAESHRTRTEMECDADGVEPDGAKPENNEVEALKAEVCAISFHNSEMLSSSFAIDLLSNFMDARFRHSIQFHRRVDDCGTVCVFLI